jgi:hypothetical protein
MDANGRYLGNTGYVVPLEDYYLLGILSSWASWFYISKTAQPLRLRGDRWQYRLIAQFMVEVPIPDPAGADRNSIEQLAQQCTTHATQRYELQSSVQRRLTKTFGEDKKGELLGTLNQKAEAWWEQSLNGLGAALKVSFKLAGNPFTNPRVADDWEPYLQQHRGEVDRLTRALADAEAELNERVYRLFDLTPDEIALLKREVEH